MRNGEFSPHHLAKGFEPIRWSWESYNAPDARSDAAAKPHLSEPLPHPQWREPTGQGRHPVGR